MLYNVRSSTNTDLETRTKIFGDVLLVSKSSVFVFLLISLDFGSYMDFQKSILDVA